MLSNIARSSHQIQPLRVRVGVIHHRNFRPACRPAIEPEPRRESQRWSPTSKAKLRDVETFAALDEPTKIPRRMASHYPHVKSLGSSGRNTADNTIVMGVDSRNGRSERGLLEKLLFSSEPPTSSQSRTNRDAMQSAPEPQKQCESIDADYVIDPITNRKVYKSENPTSLGDALTNPAIKSQFSGNESKPGSELASLVYETPGPLFDPEFPVTQHELQQYAIPKIDRNPTGRDGRLENGNIYWRRSDGLTTKSRLGATSAQKHNDLSKHEPVMETPVAPEDPSKLYSDLEKYQPVMIERKPDAENPAAKYEDLDQYKPVLVERAPAPNTSSEEYDDLDHYKPVPDVKQEPNPYEKEVYRDLPKYSSAFADTKLQPSPFEKEVYEDLHLYAEAFPDVKAAPNPYEKEVYDDLHLYEDGFSYQEPDGKPPVLSQFEKEKYTDLNSYNAYRFNEPDGEPAKSSPYEKEVYTDLSMYSEGYRASEPDGYYALRYSDRNAQVTIENIARAVGEVFRFGTPQVRERSWGLGSRSQTSFCKDPKTTSFHSCERQQLTGSKEKADRHGYSLEPMGLETSYIEESARGATSPAFASFYGSSSIRRSASPKPRSQDLSSSSSVFSSTSSNSSSASSNSSSTSSNSVFPPGSSSQEASQSTVYKILAYDPSTQTVEIAETSSTVPDSMTALPPAEALLRLAHPTKFFPHFGTLESQGFEIVSGSGDVLVFRKIRQSADTATMEQQPPRRTAINPIDMTGAPIFPSPASAFLSPTGFVRYDDTTLEDDKLPPPPPLRFQSKSQRETFADDQSHSYPGAPSYHSRAAAKTPRRVVKKIFIGATSVAGLAYAAGVVGEYFQTADGNASKRL